LHLRGWVSGKNTTYRYWTNVLSDGMHIKPEDFPLYSSISMMGGKCK